MFIIKKKRLMMPWKSRSTIVERLRVLGIISIGVTLGINTEVRNCQTKEEVIVDIEEQIKMDKYLSLQSFHECSFHKSTSCTLHACQGSFEH